MGDDDEGGQPDRRRNERIEHYQKNRNPFVDDSTLADRIDDF